MSAPDTEEKETLVSQARDRYVKAKEVWGPIYEKARADLKFLSDEPDAQWDPEDLQKRKAVGLSCITLDKVDQSVHQVINNIRQNTPAINVIPDGEGGTQKTADAFKGIIKGIEYNSRADSAYDTGAENAVKARIGFIRVDNEYSDDETFLQKLCIKRVVNPLACYIDPMSIEVDGSDANWGFVLDTMTVREFKANWPEKNPISFDADKKSDGSAAKDDDEIMIAEYFCKEMVKRDIVQLRNGETADFAEGLDYTSKRTVSKIKITRSKLSGDDELETTTFPGKYIPIVPVYGKEAWEDGKRRLQSLISKVKPGARLHNTWASIETDMLMKASRSPVTAAEGSYERHIDAYRNPDKYPVLPYTAYDSKGQLLPPPQRLDPFPIPTGVVNARRESVDDIKAAMGIFNASLGLQSNETSGVAIARRQQQGDSATFHYGDNLVKSIEQVGRILVHAIPEIYDTERFLLSVDEEDKTSIVGVNGAMADGQEEPVDLKAGRYTVRVTTGASSSTKRQETVAALGEMFAGNPDLIARFGDIYFKNSDFAGAQAMASRAEKMLPPELKEDENGASAADAQVQQMTGQMQQMEQVIEQLHEQLQNKQIDAQNKMQGDLAKAEIDRQIKVAELEMKRIDLAMKDRELAMKELDMRAQVTAPQSAVYGGPESGGFPA
jgi:hypothetical protein